MKMYTYKNGNLIMHLKIDFETFVPKIVAFNSKKQMGIRFFVDRDFRMFIW